MSGGNSSNNGNRSGSGDDEGWGSKFLKVASAAAAAATVAGGLYALLKSSSSSNSEPEAPFQACGRRVRKEPDDVDGPCFLQHDDNIPSSPIGWTKPESGWVKLNVDGSKVHEVASDVYSIIPSAGCGGVLRDESGEWLQGFAEKLDPSCEVHETELLAILRGMELASEMNVKKLVVESDNESAVSMVKNGCKFNHSQFDLISRIRQLLFYPKWQVKVSHIPGKANRVADRLANDARNLPTGGLRKYPDPPDNCTRLVKEDAQGVSYY